MRHGVATTAVVVAVCAGVVGVSVVSYGSATAELAPLSARAHGTISGVSGDTVTVTWRLPGGRQATAQVTLATDPPALHARTEVAYDPADPTGAIVPGADVLAYADRAQSGITFGCLVALIVLLTSTWLLVSRTSLRRREPRPFRVRRVRIQRGLITRSWLETENEPRRWLPVYFEPELITLPAPCTVLLYGDPRGDRLVAAEVNGARLYPSGRVTGSEPRGRRGDNPTDPDAFSDEQAVLAARLRRQFRVDAALLIQAPLVGLFWAFLDGSGFSGWLAATVITAALGLWWAAIRGSDPS